MSFMQYPLLPNLLARLDLSRKLRPPMFGANNDFTVRLLEAGQFQLAGTSQSTSRAGAETTQTGEAMVQMAGTSQSTHRAGMSEAAGCLPSCLPGKKHGCANKSYGKPRHGTKKSCAEVERVLGLLGVNPEEVSSCAKAAIMRGHLQVAGEEGELEKVVMEGRAEVCGHFVTATLEDLLYQPDYVGNQWLEESPEATLECGECGEEVFLTGLCRGQATFECGKYHTHCVKCPGFGSCIGDYRMKHCDQCGRHKWEEFPGFLGGSPCDNRKCVVFKKWQADGLKGGLEEMGLGGFLLDEEIKNLTGVNPSF